MAAAIATAVGLIVIFCMCASQFASADEHKNGADVFVLEPHSNFSALYNEITFKVAIMLHPGSILMHRSYICISEVGSSAGDLCVEQGVFTLSGFTSGTHVIIASLRSFADEASFQSGSYQLMGSTDIILDTVDSAYLVKHATDSQLSHRILQTNPELSRLDYLYVHNRERNLNHSVPYGEMTLHPDEYTVIARPALAAVETVVDPEPKLKRVALFMASVLNVPPSDRYKDWLCEHIAFAKHGYELSIITADNGVDDGVRDICGVAVRRFKSLSLEYAASHTVALEDLQDATAQDIPLLVDYLTATDIVIICNTYGDHQTSLLLDVIHYMRISAQNEDGSMKGTAPLMMIDLPNLEVPNAWHQKIDALIAPSKATGLHRLSIALGKPIAVIYPPVRDNVIRSSFCAPLYHQYCALHGTCSSQVTSSADTVTTTTTAVAALDAADTSGDVHYSVPACEPLSLPSSSSVLNRSVFNFLFVGRLAAVKCPGLVVRALGYLLRSTYWTTLSPSVGNGHSSSGGASDSASASAAVASVANDGVNRPSGDGGSEGEAPTVVMETADKEFYQDLVSVARQFAPGIEEEGVVVSSLLEAFRRHAHATFIGSGELIVTNALRDLAFRLNVSDAVSFDGPQAPENVIKYMQQADVLLNPIVRGETFGFIHIEAAAQGLPVIAFNMSANSESIVDVETPPPNRQCGAAADTVNTSKDVAGNDCASVGRILPFRDKHVIQDLALAMVRAYVNSAQHPVDRNETTENVNTAVDVSGGVGAHIQSDRQYLFRNRVRNVTAICERVVPMFAHWNVQQHGRALMQAMDKLLAN